MIWAGGHFLQIQVSDSVVGTAQKSGLLVILIKFLINMVGLVISTFILSPGFNFVVKLHVLSDRLQKGSRLFVSIAQKFCVVSSL